MRRVQLVLEGLSLDEGDTLHEMQRVLGTIEEMSELDYPFFRGRQLPLVITQKG